MNASGAGADPLRPSRTARPLEGAGRLARALLADQPRRSGLAAVLLLASAATETFSIALIIPFLHLAGLSGADGVASPVRDAVAGAAAALGVDPT